MSRRFLSPAPRPAAARRARLGPAARALVGALLGASLSACAPGLRLAHDLPAFTHAHGSREVTEVPTRDGVALRTVVHLPRERGAAGKAPYGGGPWPTVLIRNPYPVGVVLDVRCRLFTRYGLACVRQRVRGRGNSGGVWDPFRHEREDGMDTLDWLAERPWSAGAVAMHGESYLAATQWVLAAQPHPTLRTIVPSVFGTDLAGVAFEGGLLRHELITTWAALMPTRGLRVFAGARYRKGLRHRPQAEADLVFAGEPVDWYRAWLPGDAPDAAIWQDPLARAATVTPRITPLPVLMIGGWGDVFLGPQVATWEQLATRDRSTLILGPWQHIGFPASDRKLRGRREGPGGGLGSQWPVVIDWMRHHLQGTPLSVPTGAYTFAAHAPKGLPGWRHRPTFPRPEGSLTLRPVGPDGAATCDGTLTWAETDAAQPGQGTVSWRHDPANPAPSTGGAGLLAGLLPGFSPVKPGFRFESPRLCAREDVLGFQTEPLEAPLTVSGRLAATVRVRTSTPDSALMVRLVEVLPSGRRTPLAEVLTGIRHAVPTHDAGVWSDVPLLAWPVEAVVGAGSRLAIELGSASFPRVASHPNTARSWEEEDAPVVATLEVDLAGVRVTVPTAE